MCGAAPSSSMSRLGGCHVGGRQGTKREVGFRALALQVQGTPASTGAKHGFLAEFLDLAAHCAPSGVRHGSCIAEGPNPWDERSPSRPRPARAVIFSRCPVLAVSKTQLED